MISRLATKSIACGHRAHTAKPSRKDVWLHTITCERFKLDAVGTVGTGDGVSCARWALGSARLARDAQAQVHGRGAVLTVFPAVYAQPYAKDPEEATRDRRREDLHGACAPPA